MLSAGQVVESCESNWQAQYVSQSNGKRIIEKNNMVLEIERAVPPNNTVPHSKKFL
jgi:hypothetical protein